MQLSRQVIIANAFLLAGCIATSSISLRNAMKPAPKSFVMTMEPSWAMVELREDITFEKAWATVMDIIIKRFDIEIIQKEDGYLRTSWLHTWTGKEMENYRVRVTIKFSMDHMRCEVKSEAEYGGPGNWTMGYDSRLIETIKTDLMGSIGRTTR